MSNRNEALDGGEGERGAPCDRAHEGATCIDSTPGDDMDSVFASLAYLFDGAEPEDAVKAGSVAQTTLPAKRVRPLTLPKLRPRPVRILPPPSVLPPRTFLRVDLPPAAEMIRAPLEDMTTLGTMRFPLGRRWALALAGATLVAGTCLVAGVSFSDMATSRAGPTPDALATLAAATAAAPPPAPPAADVPTSAGSAPPAPRLDAATASLSPSRALPAEPRRGLLRVTNQAGGAPAACLVTPPRATEKKASHRLFGVED